MAYVKAANGSLFKREGECEECGAVGTYQRSVRLRGQQRNTAVYACTNHTGSVVRTRHVWANPIFNGVDYSAAWDIGMTHGSTASYVAGLILERGHEAAYEWADRGEGISTRKGRHSLVKRVLTLMA